jgi:hypothetical protein
MKLCVPPGCGAASHNGHTIEIDAQGCVDVDEEAAHALAAHGFIALSELEGLEDVRPRSLSATEQARPLPPADHISQLNRRSLFAFLKERGVGVSLPVTNDELRALARAALAKAVRDSSADEGS